MAMENQDKTGVRGAGDGVIYQFSPREAFNREWADVIKDKMLSEAEKRVKEKELRKKYGLAGSTAIDDRFPV